MKFPDIEIRFEMEGVNDGLCSRQSFAVPSCHPVDKIHLRVFCLPVAMRLLGAFFYCPTD